MSEGRKHPDSAAPAGLSEHLKVLEDTHRATLNMLEDFDQERAKLRQVQVATMNILDDAESERRRYRQIQTATLNLLEDFHEEQNRGAQAQAALMNILEDIESERAGAEQAKTQLEAANRELEAFSYSVSHDLRAPLRALSGFSEALLEDYLPALDAEGRKYLQFIAHNANKMGQLVDDLLTFSRLGRQEMLKRPIDMEDAARRVFSDLVAQLPELKIAFALRPAPPASGDSSMIQQVLTNLFSNAIKFTRRRQDPAIEFGHLPETGGGAYYVRDNGAGFDMQYVDKLFGVFQRLHEESEFEGTGVGLALVHRIITRHGGRVWAEAKVNEGATFYFTLPGGEMS